MASRMYSFRSSPPYITGAERPAAAATSDSDATKGSPDPLPRALAVTPREAICPRAGSEAAASIPNRSLRVIWRLPPIVTDHSRRGRILESLPVYTQKCGGNRNGSTFRNDDISWTAQGSRNSKNIFIFNHI